MEQKKISQCNTMEIDLNGSYPDAYLAAINKLSGGSFQNFKLKLGDFITALNSKFTALSNRIDGMSGEDSGEGTTPSTPTDLTEVNNRLQAIENEISNFKTSSNWPINTILLTNNAGAVIATYDLPSNYLGTGYTGNNSIQIKVNSEASPKYQITVQTNGWTIDELGNISFRIKAFYGHTSQQLGGTITSLVAQATLNAGSTILTPTDVNLISESTLVSTILAEIDGTFTSLMEGASSSVITATVRIFLDGGASPIITLTSVFLNSTWTAAAGSYIVTT